MHVNQLHTINKNIEIPRISIIIPVFNRANVVLSCLESVQKQTFPNWECIIVDDSSTDNTYEAIKEFSKIDKRFKLYSNTRTKGANGARNTGLEMSDGDYLIFLDSDDLLAADCLFNRIKKFEEFPENDFLVFSTIEFKKNILDTNILLNVNTSDNVVERFLNLDVPWVTMAPIWKRSSFLELGQWNEMILSWQDWELHIRAILKNYKFKYFSQVDNYLRRDPSIRTMGDSSLSREHLNSHLNLLGQLEALMKGNPHYIDSLHGLAFWIATHALTNGYKDIAKKGFQLSHKNCHVGKRIINKIGLHFFRRFFINSFRTPDFGTMRKVYS